MEDDPGDLGTIENSFYWLDPCEDLSNEMFDGLISADDLLAQSSLDNTAGDVHEFFGGIDHILESIKSGAGLCSFPAQDTNGFHDGVENHSLKVREATNNAIAAFQPNFEGSTLPLDSKDPADDVDSGLSSLIENDAVNIFEHEEKGSGPRTGDAETDSLDVKGPATDASRGLSYERVVRERDCDGEERENKRAKVSGVESTRPDYVRDKYDRNRGWTWKRQRDWEENKVHMSRRDCLSSNNRKVSRGGLECKGSDPKGFWERDPLSNEMIYHQGKWEIVRHYSKIQKSNGNKPVKECLEKKYEEKKEILPEQEARQYQLEVLDQAKKRNTIAFLETGSGKTLIAVLLIRSFHNELQMQNKKLLAVFLVPKIPLVYQQAEVIRDQTGLQVGHYCGEMGQNFWDPRRWQHDFETKQVLVMTAQILLNILRHSIVKMEAINLLILDECHHAVKKHPYSLVMSEFYHTTPKNKRPSVFGMTASPVNLKGVASQEDCAIKIRNLETKMDSTVCTIKDRKELEKYVPMPSEVVVEYDPATTLWSIHEQIQQFVLAVEDVGRNHKRSKWKFMGARDAGITEELYQVYGVPEKTEFDGVATLTQKLRAIDYALGELGQWCAYKVAHFFLTALKNDSRVNYELDAMFQESFLEKAVSLLHCQLTEGAAAEKDGGGETGIASVGKDEELEEGELLGSHVASGGEHVDVATGAAVADGKVTPKVQSLVKLLLKYQHTPDFRAIVFVERVVTALVLPKVFAELPSLSFIRCASLIGHNNQEMPTHQMQDTIEKFRDGRVTLLVATSVAEEGLDIRQCNLVIRFDLAKTVLAYIQSRGRARKSGSVYILMVERGNLSHISYLTNARCSEETLRKEAIERTDIGHLKDISKLFCNTASGSVYQVEATGAIVSLNSAVGLIHLYCSQLPSDRYSILRPEFMMKRHERPGVGGATEYSCVLQLPCNAAFDKLEGPACNSMRLAQQGVCLAACKKLHEMGAFTDMLLPDKGSKEEKDASSGENDEGQPLPGTARHREFYPEGIPNFLQGEWILRGHDTCSGIDLLCLFMYAVTWVNCGTSKDPFLTQVSDFSILFGSELDAEVLSMSIDLFIARTMITKAFLKSRGQINITETQLASLKSFHVRVMSVVLDVDVEPSSTPWNSSKAYLFVPIKEDEFADGAKEIDWDLVEQVIRSESWSNPLQKPRPDIFLGTKERTLGGDKREYGFRRSHPTYGIRGAVAEFDVVKATGLVLKRDTVEILQSNGKLIMADGCVDAECLVGKIVTSAHSGKRFYVDSICHDMSAENSFPRKEGFLGPLLYSSYADYYKQKYGVELLFKNQPLIKGRGVSFCKNLLSPRFQHSEDVSEAAAERTYHIFLPPELCFVHPLHGSLVRGAQRLPSIMRRVESMLLALQLKHTIQVQIPASKILEALTAASCQETFCYERAELLGDAYLKWVVSRFLFLKYPQKHEGQLTRMRQQMVSNVVLYQHALNKQLQSYIQVDRFAPSRWAAPGVLPVYDEDTADEDCTLFDQSGSVRDGRLERNDHGQEEGLTEEKEEEEEEEEEEEMEEGEVESDSGSYRVLSSKTLADVVEALIGVYYVEGGKGSANYFMKWVGIPAELDSQEPEDQTCPSSALPLPEKLLKSVDFDSLEASLNIKFADRGLLLEAITHASRPSLGIACYQRLEFVGDAVLDHLITKHLFFTYTHLPPGRLTDLRAAAVNNENFARVAVKHKLHAHLRHGSTALDKKIREFVQEVEDELSKPSFNSFGLSDCKAPKVLGDIVESIAGAIFLDSRKNTKVVWKVFQPLLHPMVTPETLPMHPVRELQERCQQNAESLEYKSTRSGALATVEVFIDGIHIGVAQNSQRKMAQKLAARNTLATLKDKEMAQKTCSQQKATSAGQPFTRQTLNDTCLRKNWPLPSYRCVDESGPAHARRFTFAARVNTGECGWTDECVGEPMPSVKKAKDSAAALLLQLIGKKM